MSQVQISEVVSGIRRFVGDHVAGNYCVSTGPITGTIADHVCVICEANKLADRIEAHGIAPPEGWVLVPVKDCTMCENTGAYHTAEGYAVNCFCRGELNSRYNQSKVLLAAAPKQEVKP